VTAKLDGSVVCTVRNFIAQNSVQSRRRILKFRPCGFGNLPFKISH